MRRIMKFIIPNDYKTYVRKYILRNTLPFAFLEAIAIAATVIIDPLWFPEEFPGYYIMTCIVLLLLPFIITRFPLTLIDRTYYGKVMSVEVGAKDDCAYLSVIMDGKRIEVKTKSDKEIKDGNQYKKGDLVFHLYGTHHTVILPEKTDEMCHCPVCGRNNRVTDDICNACGYSANVRVEE